MERFKLLQPYRLVSSLSLAMKASMIDDLLKRKKTECNRISDCRRADNWNWTRQKKIIIGIKKNRQFTKLPVLLMENKNRKNILVKAIIITIKSSSHVKEEASINISRQWQTKQFSIYYFGSIRRILLFETNRFRYQRFIRCKNLCQILIRMKILLNRILIDSQ